MRKRRRLLSLVILRYAAVGVFLAGSHFGNAAQKQQEAIPDRLLVNQDIVEMLRGGLSPRAVIRRIHESPCKFDKSAAGLQSLHDANVPYNSVLAMMQAPELPPLVNGHIPMLIPDSTLVQIALSESLDTASQKPGYVVYFRVLEDVRVRGLRVIAKGARARGRLLDSRARSRTGEAARLEWNLMDVETVDGQRLPMRGGSERTGDDHNQEKSASAEEGEEFQAFTYGTRKVNVPAPILPNTKAPPNSETSHPN